MNILITGGAGYIGSHVAKHLLEKTSNNIFIIDNFSMGNKRAIDFLSSIRKFSFFETNLQDFKKVEDIICKNSIDVIMHFAASMIVSESVRDPLKYYRNNTMNTINLIQSAKKHNVRKFIFSSTAAVYGSQDVDNTLGIKEKFKREPINPYGNSKLMSEIVLEDSLVNSSMKYIIFRYFNVAGADIFYQDNELIPRIGQRLPVATHLVNIAAEVACGKRDKIDIYGTNYKTFDGTCIRDYIHVDDLALAHVQAVRYLEENESNIFNVGYGKGYSVFEVIHSMEKVSGKEIIKKIVGRREGDPEVLIANNEKIKSLMHWKPRYDDIDIICESAYKWEMQ